MVLRTYVSVFTPLAHSLFSPFVLIKQPPPTVFLVCCHPDFKENSSKLFPWWHILIQPLKHFFLLICLFFSPTFVPYIRKQFDSEMKPVQQVHFCLVFSLMSWMCFLGYSSATQTYPKWYLPFCFCSKHIQYNRIFCTKYVMIFIQFIVLVR